MKIIAFYLPQYHTIPENNEWHEPDFTEWSHMKRAQAYMEGHYQPRVPLHENYYDLTDVEVMRWQTDMAKKYGVYGFCAYHYWFDGKLLLEKPMENYLKEESIDFPYCFCWANDDWTNIWHGDSSSIKTLIMNHYDDPEDWKNHFLYMLPFFKDRRYMKEDNKPIFTIYNPVKIPTNRMKQMMEMWNRMAQENGFAGIKFTYQAANSFMSMTEAQRSLFDYGFEYFPSLVAWSKKTKAELLKSNLRVKAGQLIRSIKKSALDKKLEEHKEIAEIRTYEDEWEDALAITPLNDTIIPGAFTDWDNTPRYQRNGKILLGACPEKFEEYLTRQIQRAKEVYKKDAIMMFAWNEWSEGGYLEPDEKFGYGYLEAIRNALMKTGEFPVWDSQSDKLFTC